MKISISIISDMHGELPYDLPGGDLLIIAGDCTGSDRLIQWVNFFDWLYKQNYEKKILVAGNHDNFIYNAFPISSDSNYNLKQMKKIIDEGDLAPFNFDYLCDSSITFKGLKIHGTPWSLTFPFLNPHCAAFTGSEEELEAKYELIPNDVDILISHGPALGVMDQTKTGEHVGSPSLLRKLMDIKPRLFISGHIHEAYDNYSVDFNGKMMTFVNASIMNEDYEAVNKPVNIEIEI